MKKTAISFFIFIAISSFSFAQENNTKSKSSQNEIAYTPLKPADGRPAVFYSKEQMDASVPGKKQNALLQIKKNENDTARVNLLRMELWRLENAIIAEPKKQTN